MLNTSTEDAELSKGEPETPRVVTYDELSELGGNKPVEDNIEIVEEPVLTTSLEDFTKMANDIFISPYHTTVGSVLQVEKIRMALLKYVSTTKNTLLNYEFISGGIESEHVKVPQFIIIAGIDADEKELPIFDHPMIIRDIKGNECVCVDVRKYVRSVTDQPADILPLAKDLGSVMFIILRGLITVDFLAGKQYHLSGNKVIGAAYGMFMGNIINSIIGLNPIEKMNVDIVAAFFANMQFYPNKDLNSMVEDIIGRVANSDFTMKLQIKYVNDLISKINVNARTIAELTENIKIAVGNGKESLIDKSSILSRLAGLWFGPGDNNSLAIGLEHMPTWIALLYATCADRNFKKSRLAIMLDKNSRQIKPAEFEKYINSYIAERKHEEL